MINNANNDIGIEKKINWKYEIGETVSGKTKSNASERNLTIVDKKIMHKIVKKKERKSGFINRNFKWYKYRCNNCGNEDWVEEGNLFYSKVGCNVCGFSSQKVLIGYNDIATTAPHLIKNIVIGQINSDMTFIYRNAIV